MLDRPQVGPQMDGLLDVVWQAGGTDLLLTAGAPASDAGARRAALGAWSSPGSPPATPTPY
jgi:hypothetical protein